MSRQDDDQIGHVPKITPAHDEIASYKRSAGKSRLVKSLGEVPDVPGSGGASAGVPKTLLAVMVVILLATAGLAGYLFQNLRQAERAIENYELRISDLERRLEVTDESMSESSVAMKVKVRELDSEIRKLWDNVWKRSKAQLATHEAELEKQQKEIADSKAFISSAQQQFDKNAKVVASLTAQLKKAEQMQDTVAGNSQLISKQVASLQASMDKLNSLNADVNKMNQRVTATEEWIESINGFRRQVNREISVLKQAIGQPATSP